MTRLRNYFLTGLLVAGPASITIYISWSLIAWIDSWVKPYLPKAYNPDTYLSFNVPGFGLIVAIIMLVLIGFLTANIVGTTLIGYSETLFQRMPIVRNLYTGLKQIFSSVLAERGSSFKQAALVRFPHGDVWSIGFVAAPTKGEIASRLSTGEELLTVYVPTTPNPTGGYLLFFKKSDVILLDMSVEDAAKYVISFGLVTADTAEAALDRLMAKREDEPAAG